MVGALVRLGLAFVAGAGAEAAVKKVVTPETRDKFGATVRQAGAAFRGLGTDAKNSAVAVGKYVDRKVGELDRWIAEPPKPKAPKDGPPPDGGSGDGGKGPTAQA